MPHLFETLTVALICDILFADSLLGQYSTIMRNPRTTMSLRARLCISVPPTPNSIANVHHTSSADVYIKTHGPYLSQVSGPRGACSYNKKHTENLKHRNPQEQSISPVVMIGEPLSLFMCLDSTESIARVTAVLPLKSR